MHGEPLKQHLARVAPAGPAEPSGVRLHLSPARGDGTRPRCWANSGAAAGQEGFDDIPWCTGRGERLSTAFHNDLDELHAALSAKIGALAEHFRGPRNKALSTRDTWRFGRKGSLVVEVRGPKQGSWINWESGCGGGPFELIQEERPCERDEAIPWGRDWNGGGNVPWTRPRPILPSTRDLRLPRYRGRFVGLGATCRLLSFACGFRRPWASSIPGQSAV